MQHEIPPLQSAEHFLFANTPINIQMRRSRRWLFSCLCCHMRRSSRWDKGGEFSFQCQNKRWSDDMRNRLLVCLVLLAIMALLIKAVQTCWDISNSSTPSSLLQGCTRQNPFISHGSLEVPFQSNFFQQRVSEGKVHHLINPLKIKSWWK